MQIRKPNFERLRKNLNCQPTDSVPLIELFHDIETMDAFMKHEVNTTKEMIEFHLNAGYDYFPVLMTFDSVKTEEEEIKYKKSIRNNRLERSIYSKSEQEECFISNLEEFRAYNWSNHSWLKGGGDLSYLVQRILSNYALS